MSSNTYRYPTPIFLFKSLTLTLEKPPLPLFRPYIVPIIPYYTHQYPTPIFLFKPSTHTLEKPPVPLFMHILPLFFPFSTPSMNARGSSALPLQLRPYEKVLKVLITKRIFLFQALRLRILFDIIESL